MDKRRLAAFGCERCIMCGIEIPEGKQVCPQCEEAVFEAAAEENDCAGAKKRKAKHSPFRLFKTGRSKSLQ